MFLFKLIQPFFSNISPQTLPNNSIQMPLTFTLYYLRKIIQRILTYRRIFIPEQNQDYILASLQYRNSGVGLLLATFLSYRHSNRRWKNPFVSIIYNFISSVAIVFHIASEFSLACVSSRLIMKRHPRMIVCIRTHKLQTSAGDNGKFQLESTRYFGADDVAWFIACFHGVMLGG